MHKLHELKDMLCQELEQYGAKDSLDIGALQVVDTLAHAIKNIDKIIEAEDGYSGYYYDDGRYMGGRSYAGRKNAMRDSRGRYSGRYYYSGGGDMIEELRALMEKAPDEATRRDFQRIIDKMETA